MGAWPSSCCGWRSRMYRSYSPPCNGENALERDDDDGGAEWISMTGRTRYPGTRII